MHARMRQDLAQLRSAAPKEVLRPLSSLLPRSLSPPLPRLSMCEILMCSTVVSLLILLTCKLVHRLHPNCADASLLPCQATPHARPRACTRRSRQSSTPPTPMALWLPLPLRCLPQTPRLPRPLAPSPPSSPPSPALLRPPRRSTPQPFTRSFSPSSSECASESLLFPLVPLFLLFLFFLLFLLTSGWSSATRASRTASTRSLRCCGSLTSTTLRRAPWRIRCSSSTGTPTSSPSTMHVSPCPAPPRRTTTSTQASLRYCCCSVSQMHLNL